MKDVMLGEDNKYRWLYDMDMKKDLGILWTVIKVIAIAGVAVFVIASIFALFNGEGLEGIKAGFISALIAFGIVAVLAIPSYYIVVGMNGGTYKVLFEMDEEGIEHVQIKSEALAKMDVASFLIGLATKNLTLTGLGLKNMVKSSLHSSFDRVKKIKVNNRKGKIWLSSIFSYNQVYVEGEDFEFVRDYILQRCPQAKVRMVN